VSPPAIKHRERDATRLATRREATRLARDSRLAAISAALTCYGMLGARRTVSRHTVNVEEPQTLKDRFALPYFPSRPAQPLW